MVSFWIAFSLSKTGEVYATYSKANMRRILFEIGKDPLVQAKLQHAIAKRLPTYNCAIEQEYKRKIEAIRIRQQSLEAQPVRPLLTSFSTRALRDFHDLWYNQLFADYERRLQGLDDGNQLIDELYEWVLDKLYELGDESVGRLVHSRSVMQQVEEKEKKLKQSKRYQLATLKTIDKAQRRQHYVHKPSLQYPPTKRRYGH